MKSAANIFAGLLMLIGAIYSLMGAFQIAMYGNADSLVLGVIFIIIGFGLLVWSNRQRKPDA